MAVEHGISMSSAPKRSNDVFVYGYYGCGNIGDELLLSAVVAGIRDRRPGTHFRVRNLGSITPVGKLRTSIHETSIEKILLRPGVSRLAKLFPYLRAANAAMTGCGYFVLGGGTLFHASSSIASLSILTVLIAMARLKGMIVIGIGLGANPLEGRAARALLRTIRYLATDLAMRDQHSYEIVGTSDRVRLTADLVPGWWPGPVRAPSRNGRHVVALTLWSSQPTNEETAMVAIADGLARACHDGGCVRAMVFQDMEFEGFRLSDRPAIARLAKQLAKFGIPLEIVRPEADPDALARAFADVSVHCGARFHGAIVAALLGIPTVGLATDHKVSDFCNELDLPFIELCDVTGPRVEQALARAKEVGINRSAMQRISEASRANFQWFDSERTGLRGLAMTAAP